MLRSSRSVGSPRDVAALTERLWFPPLTSSPAPLTDEVPVKVFSVRPMNIIQSLEPLAIRYSFVDQPMGVIEHLSLVEHGWSSEIVRM